MTTKKFLKLIIPMTILLFVLVGIIYINFQQSKFKIEEGFNLKTINLRLNGCLDYVISKQDTIKEFYYNIEELKEDKVTLKALEGREYTPVILTGEKETKELKFYDENVVYNNKVYGGKAVQVLTKLIEKEVASEAFIGNYIGYSTQILFKANELQKYFGFCDTNYIRGGIGKRSELVDFFKDGKFSIVDSEKIQTLKRTYPSFDILLCYRTYDNKSMDQVIDIFGDNIMALTLNGKKYYIESDKKIYDFVNKRLPKYELGDLGDLYKATAVKDKETGLDLMPNMNWLNQVLTQNISTENTSSPTKEKRVVVYTINGKNEELTVFSDKISFRGKEYVVNNVGKNYEVDFFNNKDDKDKNKINKPKQKDIELKDGEMAVVVDGLLCKYIKDEKFIKEINDIYDNMDEALKERSRVTDTSICNFNVIRRKNGAIETLNFFNSDIGKDGKITTNNIRPNYEEIYNKIVNQYIFKIEDLKSLKTLATSVEIMADGGIPNSTLSDEKSSQLINLLSKAKVEVTSEKPKERVNLAFFIFNGKESLFFMAYDDKVYIVSRFTYGNSESRTLVINNNSELLKFINSIITKQNLFKPILPIDKGEEVTLKYDGKTVDCKDKKAFLQKTIWSNTSLFLKDDKALMDIGDKEVIIKFEYKGKVNTVKINKNGVYQNETLMYSGRYYINLIYNMILTEFGL